MWPALAAQAALWLWGLDLLPVWGDEQFTLNTVALSWGEIAATLARDIHPPLYYYLLKAWLLVAPGDPVVAARAFSVVCALAATVVLDRLWLRARPPRERVVFLALWTLSPCLLLYVRMARSYSLQLLLAALAIEAAARWLQSRRTAAALRFACAESALLYTHYLPGLAVGAAAGLLGLRRSFRQTALVSLAVILLYLPWLGTLWSSVSKAAVHEAYSLTGHGLAETAVRLAFVGTSFTVGEAVDAPLVAIAAVVAPLALVLTAWAAWEQDDVRWRLAAPAAAVAYLGATQWVSYPFVPARLLFLLPFLLGGVAWAAARRWRSGVAAAALLLAGGLGGQILYRETEGFLNNGYLIPYREMAHRIVAESRPDDALVLADAFNADPKPLVAALPPGYRVLQAHDAGFPAALDEALAQTRASIVWYARSTRDVSPGRLQTQAAEDLARRYLRAEASAYLPYSPLLRAALGALQHDQPPSHHFVLEKWVRRDPPPTGGGSNDAGRTGRR